MKIHHAIQASLAAFLVAAAPSPATDIYVDSQGSGDGSSPSSPLSTIRAAVQIAGANDTIWVRGGTGRSYSVANDAQTVAISAGKTGLSIRAYEETPGDGGHASLSVSNTFVADGGTEHIVSVDATGVTLAGFTCSYGPSSLGYNKSPASVKFVAVSAPGFTLSDCEFFCTGIPGYSGSGVNGIVAALQVENDYHAAAGMTIERCYFHDTIGNRGDTAIAPLLVANNTTIRECVFSNAWVIARDPGPNKTKFKNFTFVSNVVCAGAIRGSESYFSFANQYGSLFPSGYGGLGSGAEFAHNVFIGTGDAGRGIFAFSSFQGFGGVQRFHHNVVENFPWIWGFNRGGTAPNGKTVAEFFDNYVELSEGGSIVRDEGFDGSTVRVGNPLFVAGSFSRKNAIMAPGVFWGGASALADGYNRSVVSPLDDIVITASPEWIRTDDIFHENFYRYRLLSREPDDLGSSGWTGNNGEYPRWIGAKEPQYPESTLITIH